MCFLFDPPRDCGRIITEVSRDCLNIKILGVLTVNMGPELRHAYSESGSEINQIQVDFEFTRSLCSGSTALFLNLLAHAKSIEAKVRFVNLTEHENAFLKEIRHWSVVNWGLEHPLE